MLHASGFNLNSVIRCVPIYQNNAFYVFGGTALSGQPIGAIVRFDTIERTWTYAGSLASWKAGHNVIFDGNDFLVIGGNSNPTQLCSLEDKTLDCIELSSELTNYTFYPELFLVDKNFGRDC